MEKKEKNKYDGAIIYYANELARNHTKFTLEEQKALHIIFSYIKPFEKNPTTFKIEKKSFFEKLNLVGDSKYKRYHNLLKLLINKTFSEIVKKETNSILMGSIISDTEWFNQEEYFEVSLNSKFMPYIEQLVNHYTKLNLDSVVAFNSKHALTLYKWLCSWTDENKKINQRYLTTKELKELFGLSIDDYVYKGKFHRKLFETRTVYSSIKEINKKTNIIVSFKKRKKGNKVQNYEFNWTQKEKTHLDNHTKQNANKSQSLNDKKTQLLLDFNGN